MTRTASQDAGFQLRRAAVTDAARVARIGAELFVQTFGPQNRPDDMLDYVSAAFGESRQREELSAPGNVIWLAEDREGNPIGYAHLKLDSPAPAPIVDAPVELARIYAHQGWHGRGVGAALLEACVAKARTARAPALWLAVWKENPRGIAFYKKNGFRIAGEQTFQLGSDQQRDWVMVRSLRE